MKVLFGRYILSEREVRKLIREGIKAALLDRGEKHIEGQELDRIVKHVLP